MITLYFSFIPVILAFVGGIIWAIRLEGKVSEHEQLFKEREKQAEKTERATDDRLKEVKETLVRIEAKIDTFAYRANQS